MSTIGINECQVYGDDARKQAIWNFRETELVEFWKTNKFCHPSLTEKGRLSPYWGATGGKLAITLADCAAPHADGQR